MTLLNWAQIFIDLLEGVVHKFMPLIFISVNLFLPLKVQHLPVWTAEHGPQEFIQPTSWAKGVHF